MFNVLSWHLALDTVLKYKMINYNSIKLYCIQTHIHITVSHGCFDVHFMHLAQLCVAFSLLFAFFFFFMAQFPFQRTISTNWRTVGSRVRPNHSKPPFLRLDHPVFFFFKIPFFPILCPMWIPNPNLKKILKRFIADPVNHSLVN